MCSVRAWSFENAVDISVSTVLQKNRVCWCICKCRLRPSCQALFTTLKNAGRMRLQQTSLVSQGVQGKFDFRGEVKVGRWRLIDLRRSECFPVLQCFGTLLSLGSFPETSKSKHVNRLLVGLKHCLPWYPSWLPGIILRRHGHWKKCFSRQLPPLCTESLPTEHCSQKTAEETGPKWI